MSTEKMVSITTMLVDAKSYTKAGLLNLKTALNRKNVYYHTRSNRNGNIRFYVLTKELRKAKKCLPAS